MFVSTRRFGYTLCQPGPTSNLHRMAADGGKVRCVSMNTLSDLSPQMLPDGRVLFTRWEYIDRDLTFRQSLWTQYPDGTFYQLSSATRSATWARSGRRGRCRAATIAWWPPSLRTTAIRTGRSGWWIGPPDRKAREGMGFIYITREFPHIGDAQHEWSYRDPFPLDERHVPVQLRRRLRAAVPHLSARCRGAQAAALRGPDGGLLLPAGPPRPIGRRGFPRSGPFLPDATADGPLRGECLLVDVYRGLGPSDRARPGQVPADHGAGPQDGRSRRPGLRPVARHELRHLLCETLRGARCRSRRTARPGSWSRPCARFTFRPSIPTAGIAADDLGGAGNAGRAGELHRLPRVAAIGSARRGVDAASGAAAAERARGTAAAPDGIVDFPTVVQPVLDKHCVRCHAGPAPAGGCNLSGDKTRYFNMAYDNLLGRSRSYRQHNMETGEMLPAEQAKGKPLVHFYWLLRTPRAVNQPLWTGCFASRLPDYLTAKHCEHEIPAADRQRIYLWIDANVPYYGTYAHSRPHSPGKRDLWTDPQTGRLAAWFERDFLGVYQRRWRACHGRLEGSIDWDGRYAWIDLGRPEHSPALSAHLSKHSGGRGIDTPRLGKAPPRFADVSDPDYRAMLAAIRAGRALALQTPEADMPGFQARRTIRELPSPACNSHLCPRCLR